MKTISKLFADWLNMLMGKPRSSLPSVQSPIPSSKKNKEDEVPDAENPIASDMAKAKEVSRKLISSIGGKLKPPLSMEKKVVSDSNNFVADLIANVKIFSKSSLARRIGIGLLIFVFVIFAVSIVSKLVVRESGPKAPVNLISGGESPTPIQTEVRPSQPSVYSNDKTILELEERLNILSRQIDSINIRENTLVPPDLDFSIGF